MRASEFAEYGGPDVLQVVESDEPHPGPGQVRIAVRAAGVNQIDSKIRAGHMQDVMPLQLPAGSGLDAAGVVDELGAGLSGVSVGDDVFGSGTDTYSEFAVLSAWAALPAGLSFEEAAGYPVLVAPRHGAQVSENPTTRPQRSRKPPDCSARVASASP